MNYYYIIILYFNLKEWLTDGAENGVINYV